MNLFNSKWLDSNLVCCLSDSERHLGHIARSGDQWCAWDATKSNPRADGFLFLGSFVGPLSAKQAVEQSLGSHQNLALAGAA